MCLTIRFYSSACFLLKHQNHQHGWLKWCHIHVLKFSKQLNSLSPVDVLSTFETRINISMVAFSPTHAFYWQSSSRAIMIFSFPSLVKFENENISLSFEHSNKFYALDSHSPVASRLNIYLCVHRNIFL